MAYGKDDLRNVMSEVAPIKDKLDAGDTSLTPAEVSTLSRAFDMWEDYIGTH